MLHGGCCGSPGNTRLQVSFILHKMMDNYKELGHVDGRICFEKGFYDPPEVDYTKSVCLLGSELEDTVSKYPQVITNKCFMGSHMFPKVQEKSVSENVE